MLSRFLVPLLKTMINPYGIFFRKNRMAWNNLAPSLTAACRQDTVDIVPCETLRDTYKDKTAVASPGSELHNERAGYE